LTEHERATATRLALRRPVEMIQGARKNARIRVGGTNPGGEGMREFG
jgi:hypothetical protein